MDTSPDNSTETDLSVTAEIKLYYDLHVPDGAKNAPLLLAVHGYGAHKRYMMREARAVAGLNHPNVVPLRDREPAGSASALPANGGRISDRLWMVVRPQARGRYSAPSQLRPGCGQETCR